MSKKQRCVVPIRTIVQLLMVSSAAHVSCNESNQKIFVDVRTIDFLDPQKHGFLIVLDGHFVKHYLHESQFPTLFVTTERLSHDRDDQRRDGRQMRNFGDETTSKKFASDHDVDVKIDEDRRPSRCAKIFYPEVIQERKVIKLERMAEKTWYLICVEFENMNRDNRTTGLTCRISRTLDKFGRKVESPLKSVVEGDRTPDSITLQIETHQTFPSSITLYLSRGGAEAKNFLLPSSSSSVSGPKKIVFENLTPDQDYGQLCLLQEPLHFAYTILGRSARAVVHECHYSAGGLALRTAAVNRLPTVAAAARPSLFTSQSNSDGENFRVSYQNDDYGGVAVAGGGSRRRSKHGAPSSANSAWRGFSMTMCYIVAVMVACSILLAGA